jgi:hypothetical protein
MRSPVFALLWENWRLTRVEAVSRLGVGIVGGSAALLLLSDEGPAWAFWILLSQHAMFWLSIARLTGGRFLDGYQPGFPFHLLYTRPVPTSVIVGVAMAYDAFSCAALYLVSAALLGFAFNQPFPLLPVAVWLVTFHLLCTCVQWSTRNKALQWLGSFVICIPFFLFLYRPGGSPLPVEFSLAEIAFMAVLSLVTAGVTVPAVARQRHGDARVSRPRTAGAGGGTPEWLLALFRFPCPTSSPARAQVWFDLKSSGLSVLAIGLALAIAIPLVLLITTQLDLLLAGYFTRPATRGLAVVVAMFSLPVVLILGGNAFGIRAKQGRTYASPFAATQACGTARMAGLKVLVRSVCLLAALLAVGTSLWTTASRIPFDVLEDNDTFIEKSRSPASGVMRAIEGAVGAMSAYELVALAFVTAMMVAVLIASRASLVALRARYRRRVNIGGWLLLSYVFVLVLLTWARQRGNGLEALSYLLFNATPWLAAAVMLFATVYLFWRALAERLLTPPQAGVAVLLSAGFGAAWVTVLGAAGVPLRAMSAGDAAWILSPTLLPLMASVLAPWSLSRVRHT